MTKPSTFSFKLREWFVSCYPSILSRQTDIGVQKVKQVLEGEDVQFNWTLISQDLDSYEAQELLYEVVCG